MSKNQDRGYFIKVKGSFQPTDLGFVVNDLLIKHFSNIVDIKFTAQMEEELDEIAGESKDWVHVVSDFYAPFEKSLQNATQLMEKVKLADEITEEICPECGKPMVVKFGRYGKFLACSGYPECKHTKPFQIKINVKCPECGSELVEKMSKKKRVFYGCSNYPDCRFATNSRPLPQPCPKCGGLLVKYGRNGTKCTKCEYKGKVPEPKTTVGAKLA